MSRPWTTLPAEPGPRIKPSNDWPPPSISTAGAPAVPRIEIGTAIAGSADVGLITCGELPVAIAKVIASVVPEAGGLSFALRIAWRSDPTSAPCTPSLVFVTAKGVSVGFAVVTANGDVPSVGSVTVAVIVCVSVSAEAGVNAIEKFWEVPAVSVTDVEPRNRAAGPPVALLA